MQMTPDKDPGTVDVTGDRVTLLYTDTDGPAYGFPANEVHRMTVVEHSDEHLAMIASPAVTILVTSERYP